MTFIRPIANAGRSSRHQVETYASSAGRTDMGMRRGRNEDALLIDESLGFYAVADGVGGSKAGDVASVTAVDAAAHHVSLRGDILARIACDRAPDGLLERLAAAALDAASFEVNSAAGEFMELRGMCTTLTMAIKAGRHVAIAHAGDSRAYLVSADGQIQQLTHDHNLAGDLERAGDFDYSTISRDRWASILTRCIGGVEQEVDAQVIGFELLPGDTLVMCTDGLTRYVHDDEISAAVRFSGPAAAVRSLINRANSRGGSDNVTVAVIRG